VNDLTLTDTYAEAALRRVWRCTHFSSSMTTMLHTSGDPYDQQLQRLRRPSRHRPAHRE
jgi:p-hydroxybenzoate 3-monooxygenase